MDNMNINTITCVNCLFFDKNNFCRRYPPQVVYSGKDVNINTNFVTTFGSAMFPIIKKPELDWCGEFIHYSEKDK